MLFVGDAPATQRRTSVARASKRVTDDRSWHGLPGKLETFAERARIVHIDVDPAEINKNKEAHIPMCTTTKDALVALNAALDARPLVDGQYGAWVTTLTETREEFPMMYPARDDVIIPQRAIQARGLWCHAAGFCPEAAHCMTHAPNKLDPSCSHDMSL